MVRLILYLPEKADVLNESGLDVFVIHELAEDVKLFPQELKGKIDLTGETGRCKMKAKTPTETTGRTYPDAFEENSLWCS